MDFRINSDQQDLRDGVRAFCHDRVTPNQFAAFETQGGFDAALWRDLAELGVFSLRLPESQGGVGLGMPEAVLVFEELGRAVAPGPVAWTHLAAGLVDGAAQGDVVVGGLDLAGASSTPILIEHWASLDALLVLYPDRVERLDPKALRAEPVATPLDPLTPLHHVEALPRGEELGGADLARRLRLEGTALGAGEMLGIAESTLDLACAYAKEREQFGRVIGSFQALKHMLADMFARQELARAGVYAAAATIAHPEVGDVRRAVSCAKIVASDAAMKNSRACIQIHGGMGFTWEVPAHFYLKRSWVLETRFGTSDEHAAALGSSAVEAR